MEISQRNYKGEIDLREMVQLAHEYQTEHLHVIDLPYRLSSWALDESNQAGLWVDETGCLIAWAMLQTPFWTVDYVLRPDVEREIHPVILDWVDRQAKAIIKTPYGHPSWFVNVFIDQMERRQELEAAGFSSQSQAGEDSWTKVWMGLSGRRELLNLALPEGFSMRSLAGEGEVEAYVELHQAVFESKNMTVGWRRRALRQSEYKPDLDMVVVAPDGKLVAFCIGWFSLSCTGMHLGQIEPLGCHADLRKLGIGRAVLCETLRRLQQLGTTKIYAETDNYRDEAFRLYESVGFQVKREVLVYRKDYIDTSD